MLTTLLPVASDEFPTSPPLMFTTLPEPAKKKLPTSPPVTFTSLLNALKESSIVPANVHDATCSFSIVAYQTSLNVDGGIDCGEVVACHTACGYGKCLSGS